MADPKAGGLAALIVGKMKPQDAGMASAPGVEVGGEEVQEDIPEPKTMAAQDMMDALKSGDVKLFADALDDFLSLAGSQENT